MKQAIHTLEVRTAGKSLVAITSEVVGWVRAQGIGTGLLTVWCRHTSASLTVQENADPAVRRDILAYFERIAPEGADYEHGDEGPDDMPAHLRGIHPASAAADLDFRSASQAGGLFRNPRLGGVAAVGDAAEGDLERELIDLLGIPVL